MYDAPIMIKISLISCLASLCLFSCNSQDSREWICKNLAIEKHNPDFAIWCPAQTSDYFIPTKYGCAPLGDAIAPPISWRGVPKEATHLRIAVIDTMCNDDCDDYCSHVHWQLDIPLKQISQSSPLLSQDAIAEDASKDPSIIALTLPNSHGQRGYLPLCVPELQTHAIVLKAIAYRFEGSKRIIIDRTQSSPLLFSFDKKPSPPQSPMAFLLDLGRLKKEERWREIVIEGEKAAAFFREKGDCEKEFFITDELVSHYYRLGEFAKACEKSKRLGELADLLQCDSAIVDSLYKLSAAVRGLAGDADPLQGEILFAEARRLGELALQHCRKECVEEHGLLAKVLFNVGAAYADDPRSDPGKAIPYYKEAIAGFSDYPEGDYLQRTEIRLGKAYLLTRQIAESRKILEKLKKVSLEQRTLMHFLYLEAQVCKEEGKMKEALFFAEKGKALAMSLDAKADRKRFDEFLENL